MYNVKLKFWFYKNYWWILFIVSIIILLILFVRNESTSTVVTFVGAILSIIYFIQKQKLEEMRLFRELFKDFNSRYDKMHADIYRIINDSNVDLSDDVRLKVIDYLNLCGEEYLYFKLGYIEPSVWEAWNNGMKIIVAKQPIQTIWRHEKLSGSYYNLPLDS